MTNTYVINLERSTERRKSIVQQLEANEISHKIIKAVDGKSLELREELTESGTDLTPAIYACAASHRRVYQQIEEDEAPVALVLEDDALIPPTLADHTRLISGHIQDHEVALLSYYYHDNSPFILKRSTGKAISDAVSLYAPAHETKVGSGLAYMLTRSTAKSLLSNHLISHTADHWGRYIEDGELGCVRCVYPQPVFPAPFHSTLEYDLLIGSKGSSSRLRQQIDRIPVLKPLLFRLLSRRIRANKKFKIQFV